MGNRLNVFISYRRVDSEDFAGRLQDALCEEFDVFFDNEGGIATGEAFPKAIQEGIEKADVVLMVIGSKSCEEFEAKKHRTDFVVEEIAHANASNCKIIPVLMKEVEMPSCFPNKIAFVSELNAYMFGRNSFSLYMNDLKEKIKESPFKNIASNQKKALDESFLQKVVDGIEKERLVVLFSQDFTDIHEYYQKIRAEMEARFSDEFYSISVPSYVNDEEEYFGCIASDCGMSCEVKRVSDWQKAIKKKLEECSEPLLLFVRDIENGDEVLDKKFATILRNLKNEYAHFHAVLVGRKALAKLVYGEGVLSPLNNAKELFFPEVNSKLGAEKIHQQFQTLGRQRTQICQLLGKKNLGRFSAWSFNDTINQLFWKNLLIREGNKFAWRGELTKEIAREAFGCGEDVV